MVLLVLAIIQPLLLLLLLHLRLKLDSALRVYMYKHLHAVSFTNTAPVKGERRWAGGGGNMGSRELRMIWNRSSCLIALTPVSYRPIPTSWPGFCFSTGLQVGLTCLRPVRMFSVHCFRSSVFLNSVISAVRFNFVYVCVTSRISVTNWWNEYEG